MKEPKFVFLPQPSLVKTFPTLTFENSQKKNMGRDTAAHHRSSLKKTQRGDLSLLVSYHERRRENNETDSRLHQHSAGEQLFVFVFSPFLP